MVIEDPSGSACANAKAESSIGVDDGLAKDLEQLMDMDQEINALGRGGQDDAAGDAGDAGETGDPVEVDKEDHGEIDSHARDTAASIQGDKGGNDDEGSQALGTDAAPDASFKGDKKDGHAAFRETGACAEGVERNRADQDTDARKTGARVVGDEEIENSTSAQELPFQLSVHNALEFRLFAKSHCMCGVCCAPLNPSFKTHVAKGHTQYGLRARCVRYRTWLAYSWGHDSRHDHRDGRGARNALNKH